MMRALDIVAALRDGRSVRLRPHGNSMKPRIHSGDLVEVSPLARDPEKGDVVFAKVGGRHFMHLVSAVQGDRVQISNNHGHVNGWTSRAQVYGLVTKI